jgi:hypothetical protein
MIVHLRFIASTHMTKPHISAIAPFFIVKNAAAAVSFYRDRLGFAIRFQGPPDDNVLDCRGRESKPASSGRHSCVGTSRPANQTGAITCAT